MKKSKRKTTIFLSLLMILCSFMTGNFEVEAEETVESTPMFRLYNPNSGEHFFTASKDERNNLILAGWNGEGYAWMAPKTSETPVYRLYNPNSGDHHYTTSGGEKSSLVSTGWNDEGIGWYSADSDAVPVYKQYNPNAIVGTHNYTTNFEEAKMLVGAGWNDESVGWYGLDIAFPEYPLEPERDVDLGEFFLRYLDVNKVAWATKKYASYNEVTSSVWFDFDHTQWNNSTIIIPWENTPDWCTLGYIDDNNGRRQIRLYAKSFHLSDSSYTTSPILYAHDEKIGVFGAHPGMDVETACNILLNQGADEVIMNNSDNPYGKTSAICGEDIRIFYVSPPEHSSYCFVLIGSRGDGKCECIEISHDCAWWL